MYVSKGKWSGSSIAYQIYWNAFFQVISLHAVKELDELQNFFTELVKLCLDADSPGARLDFLACPLIQSSDVLEIVEILEGLTQVGWYKRQ